ncbi:MAG: hypothetical protein IT477_10395 [Rhodanobacteraceae bacterium]|nr:hypothetical protein [Rhodanobacteraceae bacterium]
MADAENDEPPLPPWEKKEREKQTMFQTAGLLLGAVGAAVGVISLWRAVQNDKRQEVPAQRKINPGDHVLLVGDSIGQGIEKPLAEKLGVFGAHLTSLVSQGATASTWASKVNSGDAGFDLILLSLGSNDAAGNPSAQAGALDKLLEVLRSRGAPVYWIRPPSFRREGLTNKQETWRQMLEDRGVPELELLGAQPDTSSDPQHIHLTPNGYNVMAAQVADALIRYE